MVYFLPNLLAVPFLLYWFWMNYQIDNLIKQCPECDFINPMPFLFILLILFCCFILQIGMSLFAILKKSFTKKQKIIHLIWLSLFPIILITHIGWHVFQAA